MSSIMMCTDIDLLISKTQFICMSAIYIAWFGRDDFDALYLKLWNMWVSIRSADFFPLCMIKVVLE